MEVIAGYKQTEIGVIPEDWEIVQLADVFTFKKKFIVLDFNSCCNYDNLFHNLQIKY